MADMDHIVAIDVSTRNLVALGKRPVTCGLWFSLGHSTIVLAATLACVSLLSLHFIIPSGLTEDAA